MPLPGPGLGSTDAASITLVLGIQNLQGTNSNMQKRRPSQINIHPNYNPNTLNNDIALVQLSASVTFNANVLPVCLAATNSSLRGGTKVWVTGWGEIATN
ncbi:mast cell tryptase-like, partial [Clarias magur]